MCFKLVFWSNSWWQVIDFARLNHITVSFFNFEKPESAASRWNRISLNASKVKLEVMRKKAKTASFIRSREDIKRDPNVKSTFCNERSSRSHCMIILDVPTLGGCLMLVDLADFENIEPAGQMGLEAKMQIGHEYSHN